MQNKYDVIIGGAAAGSSIAYFLKTLATACAVAMTEPDPTYELASTPRASGGARRQFSCPENIAMSNFSIPFIKGFADTMAVNGEPAHADWHEGGYLFIVPDHAAAMLHAPAAGRAIAELVVHERFETLDLARLGYAPVSSNSPYPEHGII